MSIARLPINLGWKNVIVDRATGQTYEYPAKFTPSMRRKHDRPAIYRWFVHSLRSDKPEQIYIGEAEDLIRRIQGVLTPGRTAPRYSTNKRLKSIFDSRVEEGLRVALAVLDFSPFELEGVVSKPDSLSSTYMRRTLENLCLSVAAATGTELLNATLEPPEALAASFRKLPLSKQRKLLRHGDR